MSNVRWLDSFAIGDPVIDDDHRRLVERMKKIEEASKSRSCARVASLIHFLLDDLIVADVEVKTFIQDLERA